MAQKLVRVKLPTGREATVGESFAATHDLQVLDKPAVDASGAARPTKPRTSVAKSAESKRRKKPSEGSASASSQEESK